MEDVDGLRPSRFETKPSLYYIDIDADNNADADDPPTLAVCPVESLYHSAF